MTQTTEVLRLLRERGEQGLTPIEALALVGTFRLGARIYDLTNPPGRGIAPLLEPGEYIVNEWAVCDGKRVAKYVLKRETAQAVLPW